jgi:hypothetical protein
MGSWRPHRTRSFRTGRAESLIQARTSGFETSADLQSRQGAFRFRRRMRAIAAWIYLFYGILASSLTVTNNAVASVSDRQPDLETAQARPWIEAFIVALEARSVRGRMA